MSSTPGQSVRTTCPYCGVGCGLLATQQLDGSVTVQGDPDHPANFGRICSKGAALGDTLDLDGRLLYPEIDGKRASWDAALDLIASRFSRTIADHGPDSVAFYVSGQLLTEDYYVVNKLMKGFIGSANIDSNSRLCMASSVVGHKKAFGADTVPGLYEDFELADLIVLVGSNLAWCHPVLYQRIEAAKQQRPDLKVVVIDPRKTMTAGIADLHLALKPDGDVALFCGLLAHLVELNAIDQDYVAAHTNGLWETADAAGALNLAEVSQRSGLAEADVAKFYAWFANTEKTVTIYSQGVNQSTSGTDKVSAILNCHLATGRIGRPGMGPFSITGQPNAMGGREVGGLATMLASHMELDNADHRTRVQAFWKSPTVASKPGLTAVEMFDAVATGRIRAMWILSTNPVDSVPEADHVRAALERCPFVVVSDVLEDTDTLRCAHVKLPSAAWGEKDGSVTNSERRISRQRHFLPLPAEAKPDWWQLKEVAQRMGFGEAFDYMCPADIFAEFVELSSNGGARDFDLTGLKGLTEDEFEALMPIQWPVRQRDRVATRFFADGKFYHSDGKARFVPVGPFKSAARQTERAFTLNTGRVRDHWHTMTRTARAAQLNAHTGEPYCDIHPDDAEIIGIADAGLVVLESGCGKAVLRARISSSQQTGQLFAPMHWTDQYSSCGRVNALIPGTVDPFSKQPAFKNVRVAALPLAPSLYGFLISRTKPVFPRAVFNYWAMSPCVEGWRAEFAAPSSSDSERVLSSLGIDRSDPGPIRYFDETTRQTRAARFAGNRLDCAVYLSNEPVALAREWLCSQLMRPHTELADRLRVLAGKPNSDVPAKGAIVCACMSVGTNEIARAILDGSQTMPDIARVTGAGTNCGSCRSEISAMIKAQSQPMRAAAE